MTNGIIGGAGGNVGSPNHLLQQQQTVAMLDGDQVRCCTLTDHKLCDHQQPNDLNQTIGSNTLSMTNGIKIGNNLNSNNLKMQHHLASEC